MPNSPESRRYHERLLNYWNTLRGARAFPEERECDPDALNDIWPYCFLISIDAVTQRLGYRYSYLGESLIEAYGDNMPEISPGLSEADMPMVSKFNDIRKLKQPIIDEAEFTNKKNLKIQYRACLVPLGFSAGEVSHIIGCMRWKAC